MDFVANLRGHIARSSRASFGGWGLPNREKSIARSRPIAATMREQPNVKQQITTQRFAFNYLIFVDCDKLSTRCL